MANTVICWNCEKRIDRLEAIRLGQRDVDGIRCLACTLELKDRSEVRVSVALLTRLAEERR